MRSNINYSNERLNKAKNSEEARNSVRKDPVITKSKSFSGLKVVSLNKTKELVDIANQICKVLNLKEIKSIK